MKKNDRMQIRRCPLCGRIYNSVPALSRIDNETLICPVCGTRQALESIGIDPDEQERIIETIHRYEGV